MEQGEVGNYLAFLLLPCPFFLPYLFGNLNQDVVYIATAKEVRKLLIVESCDVGAGLLKLLLVIEHICKPAPTWLLLSTSVRAGLLRISTNHRLTA